MSKLTEGHLRELGGNIEKYAGKQVRDRVMKGSDNAARSTDKIGTALWVKEAMDRLDAAATPETCNRIMDSCGRTCYAAHAKMVKGYRVRRTKYKTEAEFLEAEIKRTVKNSRLVLQGDILIQYYSPKRMASNERCFCSLMKHLPEDITASPTYCQCSRGFIQAQWEEALGRPLKVEVMETCLTGAEECKFIIHLVGEG